MTHSSTNTTARAFVHVPPDGVENFLMSLANLRDDPASVEKFVRDFSDLCPKRTITDWSAFTGKPEWEQSNQSPYKHLPKELG